METSLGHFISIQLELAEQIKQGGEISADSNSEVSSGVGSSVKWREVSSALECRIKKGLIVNLSHLDYDKFMNDAKVLFDNEIENVLKRLDSVKVNTDLAEKYFKVKDGEEEEEEIFTFITKNFNIFQTTDLSEKFKNIQESIDQQMSELQERGSG